MTNRLLPRCSTSLTTTSERQIKTTWYHLSNVCYQRQQVTVKVRLREGESCALLVGLWKGAATVENIRMVPQEIKNGTTILSNNPLLGVPMKEVKALILICTPMFIAAKTWKQPKYQSIDKWIENIWYTHTHTHTQWNIQFSSIQ